LISAGGHLNESNFILLCGSKRHRSYAEALFALRRETGQDRNASTDPLWFASNAEDSKRRPWTILKMRHGKPVGAVLLREQVRFGVPLGYFFCCDAAGDEFVIAHPEERETCLRDCLSALLNSRKSSIVFLATELDRSHAGWGELKYGANQGAARYRLPLKSSFDETLKQFGARTRRNLRYYLRDLDRNQIVFRDDLTPAETAEATTHLRGHSDYPVSEEALSENLAAIERTANHFSVGLRSADGEWLSCMMGWRDGRRTSVFFQMNHIGHHGFSLSTAMRARFIQHEIARGQSDLIFVSYSSKVIEGGCADDPRYDLLLARHSWRMALLRAMTRRLKAKDHRLSACILGSATRGSTDRLEPPPHR
jgi:hypothetical protein